MCHHACRPCCSNALSLLQQLLETFGIGVVQTHTGSNKGPLKTPSPHLLEEVCQSRGIMAMLFIAVAHSLKVQSILTEKA